MSDTKNNDKSNEKPPEPQDHIVQTQHSITINGRSIPYTVTTGTLVIKEEVEEENKLTGPKAKASIFFIAYTRDDVEDTAVRPLTFSFNGGPGSSSVWMHLGLLGPRRVMVDQNGFAPPPPYKLVDNDHTLLDKTDLVFIDPAHTGYSRMVPGQERKAYLNFKKDIESVGNFIRLYTSRYQRWASPKFLIGESYGTTRAGGLAGYLQERHGMYLNGIMLISVVLNFQTIRFAQGNDLPHILFLPTFAATAWYHKQLTRRLLNKTLPKLLAEVEKFALNDYTLALMQGNQLLPRVRKVIVEKLALYTGLSATYIEQTNLRPEIFRFTKELLRNQRRTIGRIDSRFTGIDRDAAGERFEFDPSMSEIIGPYSATFNHYVRSELAFESDLPYQVMNPDTFAAWRYDDHENRYVDVAETLRKAMAMNPHLKIFVASGYYDLATPYLATNYTFSHLGLDADRTQNVTLHYYEAGHMMYIHHPSLHALQHDVHDFIAATLAH